MSAAGRNGAAIGAGGAAPLAGLVLAGGRSTRMRTDKAALPYGGLRAPRDQPATRARLWLVTAAGTAIAAGLGLLGITAPDRL